MKEKYLLYAEDDIDDQEVLKDTMAAIDDEINIVCVHNGQELFTYLDTLKEGMLYPCCIILDLNMPVMNGFETLKLLKQRPEYAPIPVIIFSTSSAEEDRRRAMKNGAASFITKPVQQNHIEKACREFATYCHTVSQHPV